MTQKECDNGIEIFEKNLTKVEFYAIILSRRGVASANCSPGSQNGFRGIAKQVNILAFAAWLALNRETYAATMLCSRFQKLKVFDKFCANSRSTELCGMVCCHTVYFFVTKIINVSSRRKIFLVRRCYVRFSVLL